MIFEFLSAIASIVGLLIIFIFVFVVCDKHLIPCIEVFIQGYNIPEEIAAVTLVAFGSACPELMLNTVGVIENTSDLSLPAVLGSAMIAFGLIPSLCLLLNDRPAYSIQFWPVIREVLFYLAGIAMFLYAIDDGVIDLTDSILLLSVYFLYVTTVILVHMCGSQSHIAPLPLSEDSQTALRLTSDKSEEHPSHSSSSSHSGDRINFVAARLLVANKGATKSSSGRFSMTLIPESVGTHSPLGQGINTPVTRRNVMGLSSSGLSPSMKSVVVSTDNAETPNEDEDAIESNSLLSPPTSSVGVDSRTENGRLGRSLLVRHVFGTIWDITGAVTERFVSYLIPPLHPVSCNATLVNYLRPSDQHVVQEVEITRNIERGVVASDGIGMQGEDSSATLDPLTLPVPLWRASIILFVCISYVAGSAYLIVLVASAFVKLAQLDSSTVGATLVALGSEIPDVISSITLAKHGYIDAAFASAIGSQVINVSVVVGFSSLLACFLNRSAGSEGTSIGLDISKSEIPSLWLLICVVLVVITSFLFSIFPFHRICFMWECKTTQTSTLTKSNARILLIIFLILYLLFGFRHEIS